MFDQRVCFLSSRFHVGGWVCVFFLYFNLCIATANIGCSNVSIKSPFKLCNMTILSFICVCVGFVCLVLANRCHLFLCDMSFLSTCISFYHRIITSFLYYLFIRFFSTSFLLHYLHRHTCTSPPSKWKNNAQKINDAQKVREKLVPHCGSYNKNMTDKYLGNKLQ